MLVVSQAWTWLYAKARPHLLLLWSSTFIIPIDSFSSLHPSLALSPGTLSFFYWYCWARYCWDQSSQALLRVPFRCVPSKEFFLSVATQRWFRWPRYRSCDCRYYCPSFPKACKGAIQHSHSEVLYKVLMKSHTQSLQLYRNFPCAWYLKVSDLDV